MSDTEKLEEIREWFTENVLSDWADSEAFAALGVILKREPEEEYKPIEWGPAVQARHYDRTRLPGEVPFSPGHKMDPMPYVLFSHGVEERISASDPLRVHARFAPQPHFEQDETKYRTPPRGRAGVHG